MKKLLNKIFFRKIGWGYVSISAIGFLLGFVVLLLGTNIYFQFNRIDLNSENYIVLKKKTQMLPLSAPGFTQEDITLLEDQPFVKRIGKLYAGKFKLSVKEKNYTNMSSLLAFESIPDEFIDQELPSSWKKHQLGWDESSTTVPIILYKGHLDFYNTVFAQSNETPQVSSELIKLAPFQLKLSGPGGTYRAEGRIVGFSDRINSFLVPESFLKWANKKVAKVEDSNPSRVIVEVIPNSGVDLEQFSKENDFEINISDIKNQQRLSTLNATISVAAIIGIIFIALALTIVITNFSLLIAQAKNEIDLLLQLGYTPQMVTKHLSYYLALFVGLMTLVSFLIFFILAPSTVSTLTTYFGKVSQSFEWRVLAIGLGLAVISFGVCRLSLARTLKKLNTHSK